MKDSRSNLEKTAKDVGDHLGGVLFADQSVGERADAMNVWQGLGQSGLADGERRIPVDQAQTVAAAGRIQDVNQELSGEGEIVLIDTGIFSTLNADSAEEAEERIDQAKRNIPEREDYIETLADRAGVDLDLRSAERYWSQDEFWNSIDYFLDSGETYGFEDVLEIRKRTESNGDLTAGELSELLEDRYDVDTSKIDEMASAYQEHLDRDLTASRLYFLAELGMGASLQESEGLDVKLGQRSESRYDRHGEPDHIHMNQPAALNSTAENPITVDPYIDEEVRIYAGDSRDEVREKVSSAAVDHVRTESGHGEVLNGLVSLTAYAVEISDEKLDIQGAELGNAEEVIEFAEENHPDRYSSETVADYIHENLTV